MKEGMYAKSGASARRRTHQLPAAGCAPPPVGAAGHQAGGHCRSRRPARRRRTDPVRELSPRAAGPCANPAVRSLRTIRPESVDGSRRGTVNANRLYPTSVQKRAPVPILTPEPQPPAPHCALRPPLPPGQRRCAGARTAPARPAAPMPRLENTPVPEPAAAASRSQSQPVAGGAGRAALGGQRRAPALPPLESAEDATAEVPLPKRRPASPDGRPRCVGRRAAPPGKHPWQPSPLRGRRAAVGPRHAKPGVSLHPSGSRQASLDEKRTPRKSGQYQKPSRRLHHRPSDIFSSHDSEKPRPILTAY